MTNSYNGFSGAQRDKAQRWLVASWAGGTLMKPRRCVACGQHQGVIDAHAEDYSAPFAVGKTDQFHLCFPCHMIVHCRHKNGWAWEMYRDRVRKGLRTTAFIGRSWDRFRSSYLVEDSGTWVPGIIPVVLPLDLIHEGRAAEFVG